MLAGCDMTAEDAMGCPGNEASATKQDIPKKAHAIVAEARGETGEPAARPAKRGLQRRQQSRCGFQVEAWLAGPHSGCMCSQKLTPAASAYLCLANCCMICAFWRRSIVMGFRFRRNDVAACACVEPC